MIQQINIFNYQALTGRRLYRIDTAWLRNDALTEKELGKNGPSAPCGRYEIFFRGLKLYHGKELAFLKNPS